MKTETILIGTVDEIAEHILNTCPDARIVGERRTLKEELQYILEEGALLETGGMGALFYFGSYEDSVNENNVPQRTASLTKQFVMVISDAANERKKALYDAAVKENINVL